MLAKINLSQHRPQALCLTPTRELANQILSDAVRPLSSRLKVTYEDALPGREVAAGDVCRSQVCIYLTEISVSVCAFLTFAN